MHLQYDNEQIKRSQLCLTPFCYLPADAQQRPAPSVIIASEVKPASAIAHSKKLHNLLAVLNSSVQAFAYEVVRCAAELDSAWICAQIWRKTHCSNVDWTVDSSDVFHILYSIDR